MRLQKGSMCASSSSDHCENERQMLLQKLLFSQYFEYETCRVGDIQVLSDLFVLVITKCTHWTQGIVSESNINAYLLIESTDRHHTERWPVMAMTKMAHKTRRRPICFIDLWVSGSLFLVFIRQFIWNSLEAVTVGRLFQKSSKNASSFKARKERRQTNWQTKEKPRSIRRSKIQDASQALNP